MPTSFFDLPREIRDEIYSILLISPNNLIQPRTLARSPPHIALYVPHLPQDSSKRLFKHASRSQISLSIIRTCRQVYNETHGLFWESNKFFFPNYSLHERGLVNTFKTMGQVASRLITRVCILMRPRSHGSRGGGPPYCGLAKALQTLASRARHGCLREIELVWDSYILDCTVGETSNLLAYEKLLAILRNASENCHRTIRLPRLEKSAMGFDPEIALLPRDLHYAFGGRLFVGDVLVWENYKESSNANLENMSGIVLKNVG